MRVRVSGLQRSCAKDGRKKETRGNTGRTILGKGLFWARGRTPGQAGQGNKCNKGTGRASSPRRERFLSDCLPTSLTDPVPGLSPALPGSFLHRSQGEDAQTGGSALLGQGKGAGDAPRTEIGDAVSPHSQVLVIAPARAGPIGDSQPITASQWEFHPPRETPPWLFLQTPNLNQALRTGLCPLAVSLCGGTSDIALHPSIHPSITRRTPHPARGTKHRPSRPGLTLAGAPRCGQSGRGLPARPSPAPAPPLLPRASTRGGPGCWAGLGSAPAPLPPDQGEGEGQPRPGEGGTRAAAAMSPECPRVSRCRRSRPSERRRAARGTRAT